MAERTHIPTSPACGQWETLLADALDGLLRPEDEATFSSHMASCTRCAELFDEARRGREWLNFLSPEPEVPEGLLDKILIRTGPGHKPGHVAIAGGAGVMPLMPAWQRPGFMGHVRRFAEPRLMLTAAMAFFSVALTLNLTGVKLENLSLAGVRLADLRLSDLRLSDLRPAAMRSHLERGLTMASVPIVRYYDHLRLVYEVESTVRELRGDAEGDRQNDDNRPQQPQPAGAGQSRKTLKDGGSHVNLPPFEPPQQSGVPARQPSTDDLAFTDYLETSLRVQGRFQTRPCTLAIARWETRAADFGGSALRLRERNIVWIA